MEAYTFPVYETLPYGLWLRRASANGQYSLQKFLFLPQPGNLGSAYFCPVFVALFPDIFLCQLKVTIKQGNRALEMNLEINCSKNGENNKKGKKIFQGFFTWIYLIFAEQKLNHSPSRIPALILLLSAHSCLITSIVY